MCCNSRCEANDKVNSTVATAVAESSGEAGASCLVQSTLSTHQPARIQQSQSLLVKLGMWSLLVQSKLATSQQEKIQQCSWTWRCRWTRHPSTQTQPVELPVLQRPPEDRLSRAIRLGLERLQFEKETRRRFKRVRALSTNRAPRR